jgi:predicted ATPase
MRAPPRYLTSFVGRLAERRAAHASLCPGRVVMLVGMGGVGKTRLAAEIGRKRQGRTLFVDAASAREPEDLARALLRDLGSTTPLPSGTSLLQHAGSQLRASGASLCVLDDLDRLEARAAPVLSALVEAAPEAAFLATSRVAEAGPAEHVEHRLVVEPVSVEEGVELYLGVLPPSRVISTQDRARIGRIVQRLGGVPLAIELASGRSAVLPLEEVEQGLERPLVLLRDPSRPEHRGSALALSIAASWELLPPETASVLAQSSVFAGVFDQEAARAVLEVTGELEPHLKLLVSRFLLQAEGDRFAPYESVRAFAADRLRAGGQEQPVLDRHGAHLASVAQRCEQQQLPGSALLQVRADLDAVIARGLAPGARPEALSHACVAANRGYLHLWAWHEPQELVELYRALSERAPAEEKCRALCNLAYFSSTQGRYDETERALQEADALARARGDEPSLVMVLTLRVRVTGDRGDMIGAEKLGEEALPVVRASGDRRWLVSLLTGRINGQPLAENRYEVVLARFDEARVLAEEFAPDLLPMVLSGLAELEIHRGQLERAAQLLAARRTRIDREDEPFNVVKQVALELRLEGTRGGPAAIEQIRARLPELESHPDYVAEAQAILALLEAIEGTPSASQRVTDALEHRQRHGFGPSTMLRCACALLGMPLLPLPAPFARGPVTAKVELVLGVLFGTVEPEVALARVGVPPVTPVDRALEEAARRVNERRSTWTWDPAARTLTDPRGAALDLARQARLAGLVSALAAGGPQGLDVAALFGAAWPGERAATASQHNRVRVAITSLRKRGVPIGWARERGWFFEVPVRTIS